jgi:hypothetical protein
VPAPAPEPTAEPAKDASATPSPNPPQATPEEQAPLPVSSLPGKTAQSPAPQAAPGADKGIYEEYYDYLDKQKEIQANEKDVSQRNLFPHENGAWQLGLIYVRSAFNGYNFDQAEPSSRIPNPPKSYADTQGGNLLITWFPIKSLSFGRLGFGVTGGIYWSTFNTATPSVDANGNTAGTVNTKASPQEVVTYGARAVYEFDYWLGQILVPFAFLGADQVVMRPYSVSVGSQAVVDIAGRHVVSQYYGGGVHFNLNRVEPVVASRALVNVGVKKFYLSYMALQRTGELSGLTHNVGLNFEF